MVIAPGSDEPRTLIALGSHDLGLALLSEDVESSHVGLISVPVGSLDGLIALRQGLCDIAGCHLFDDERNEYNTPFLRHLFPDIPVLAVTLAYRSRDSYRPREPLGLRGIADLAREGIRLANRNPGSGTRVWLDARLRHESIDPERIAGYEDTLATHTAVANAIASGAADAGVGLRASAEALGLGFTPLFMERYDLVMRKDRLSDDALVTLLDALSSRHLKRTLGAIAGYDTEHTGEEAGS